MRPLMLTSTGCVGFTMSGFSSKMEKIFPAEAREVFACVKESYRDSDVVELTSGITAFLKQSLSYTGEEASASKAKALFVRVEEKCQK